MNEELRKELSAMAAMELPEKYTSVSYAVMIGGEIVARDNLGTTGGEDPKPAHEKCTYNVASISKIFCTTAVMQLVEKGLLDLDKPVIEYVPEFSMPDGVSATRGARLPVRLVPVVPFVAMPPSFESG